MKALTGYVDMDNPEAVLIQNRGNVDLLHRFWQPDTVVPHGDMVHPIIGI